MEQNESIGQSAAPHLQSENHQTIIYVIDHNGFITYVSEAIEIAGYEPQELIGSHFSVLVHPQEHELVCRDKVLPQFVGKKTGDKYAPKLFDERRTGQRKTRGLRVRLIPKEGSQYSVMVCVIAAAGHYRIVHNQVIKEFMGTVGMISPIPSSPMERQKFLENAERFGKKTEVSDGVLSRTTIHEFNNLLTAIYGNVQLIELKIQNAKDITDNLSAVKSATERAIALLETIKNNAGLGGLPR